MGKRYDRFHLGVMNVGARIFGGGMLLFGVIALISAAFGMPDRGLTIVVGLVALAIGAASFFANPVTDVDLQRIRTLGRDPSVRFRYEKDGASGPSKSLERTREK
jgi:hypothetical protein